MPTETLYLQQIADGDILITAERLPEGVWAEIGSVLLAHGASPSSDGFGLTPLSLRLAANELGELLLLHDIKANYDDPTLRLLRSQVEEFRARTRAEQDTSPLPESEILQLVRATGRLSRELTST